MISRFKKKCPFHVIVEDLTKERGTGKQEKENSHGIGIGGREREKEAEEEKKKNIGSTRNGKRREGKREGEPDLPF